MWYQIMLLNIICFFASCKTNSMLAPEYKDVKLTINTTANIVSDSINITVSLENNTNSNFYLLNRKEVAVSQNKAYAWNLEVLFKDTVLMISPIYFFSKISKPTMNDYILLKSGNKYTFNFNMDFNKLVRTPSEFGSINDDFGEYTMKLKYKDPFCIVKDAIKEEFESNVLKVTFKK